MTAAAYNVFCGVENTGHPGPGPHAIGLVVVGPMPLAREAHRDEWAAVLAPADMTTPRAWLCAIERALARCDRPRVPVTIAAHDLNMVRLARAGSGGTHADLVERLGKALAERPSTALIWLPAKPVMHPEMIRAQVLARAALAARAPEGR